MNKKLVSDTYCTILILGTSSLANAAPFVGPAAPVERQSDQDSKTVYDLMPGCSVGVSLPTSGAPWGGSAAAGLRCLTPFSTSLGGYVQYGRDKQNHTESYGIFVRAQYFFDSTRQALPYLFLQGMYGENNTDASETTLSKTESVSGAAIGGGVEVFVLPEISLAADVGVASRLTPQTQMLVSTFTSQIAAYFHF